MEFVVHWLAKRPDQDASSRRNNVAIQRYLLQRLGLKAAEEIDSPLLNKKDLRCDEVMID